MTNITLRDATPADVPEVRRLVRSLAEYERNLHRFVASEADIHALLFGPVRNAYAVLAIPTDHPPVGIALFYYTIYTFAGRRGIFLEDLFVERAHRGTGIGLALVRHLAARAVADNCSHIEWHVLNWNQPALDFYQSIGATKVQDWQVRQLHGPALTALVEGATIHG